MAHLISGQEFRSEEIIAKKMAAEDFDVFVSPAFEIDGVEYQVVLDGHHSYDAAIRAGREPNIIEQTEMDSDKIALLNSGELEDFLLVSLIDLNQYVFISTDREVW